MKSVIFWFIVVFLLIGGFWYWSNKQEGNINLPFSFTGQELSVKEITPTPSVPPSSISEKSLKTLIKDYLPVNLVKPNFGGKVFCDYHLYGYDDEAAYLWAHCEEYYLENNKLKSGTGLSLPIKIELTGQKEVLAISTHKIIEDGDGYEQILRDNFPQNMAEEALLGYPQEKLTNLPEKQAKSHFSL